MRLVLAAVCVLAFAPLLRSAEPDGAGEIKVMSYNLRYGTAKDGDNHWDKRKDFLAETVKTINPDLLGTQETLVFQRDFLAETLPTHEAMGVGRDDGAEKGEMAAIFWRKDRFEKLDGGYFWLSPTPEVVASKGWDTALTRMATWVKLKDKQRPEQPILWINTHLDHKGKVARVESAKLIRDRFAALGKDCSLVLTGDFNSGEASEAHEAMFSSLDGTESPLVDTYRVAHPQPEEFEGTGTPFLAAPIKGNRIDWIGASREWKVVAGDIDHPNRDGHTSSDHFPVWATLRR